MSIIQSLKKKPLIRILASLKTTLTCLLLLTILTFWGTLYQTQHGLYAAQHRFFYSWFFLAGGWFPFPGAQGVLWIFFINLLITTLFRFLQYGRKRIGIIIIHLGLLTFFISAFVTFYFAQESFLSLEEGESSNVSVDYHNWELAFWKESGHSREIHAIPVKKMGRNAILYLTGFNIKFQLKNYYTNCAPAQDTAANALIYNAAGIRKLTPLKDDPDPEKNMAGGLFYFPGAEAQHQNVMFFGGELNPALIRIDNQDCFIQLRRIKYPLPMLVKLRDFRKQEHPGTEIAKSFESDVELLFQSDLKREVRISMNNPLRYQNFTFFQASFHIDDQNQETSTFAVVENIGRILPYLASGIAFTGLLLHFISMLFGHIKKLKP